MKKLKKSKGITLVALIITIIILLILAGISISALTNQGLFGRANDAKRESEIANIKEQIALDIYEKQLEPPLGSITDEQLETILEKHGTVNKEDGTIVGITTEKGYEILLKDIYGGETVAESVPDGATVTPVNDITTWLKTGEISRQYSYTTIEQVIADSTCTESLMNNENAMKYLARSTEFVNAICASETVMTYLGQSAYVDDTVLNSDSWINAIQMSPYWNKVSNIIVTLHGASSETITITGLYGSPTITTNSNGNVNYSLPIGTFSFSGAVSGQSFTRTIDKNTTDLYVMPEHSLYWYGNKCTDITGGWGVYCLETGYNGNYTENTNNIVMSIYGYASNNNGSALAGTSNKIDFSIYNTLQVEYAMNNATCGSSEASCGILLPATKPTTIWSSATIKLNNSNRIITSGDVSSINESRYVGIRTNSEGGTATITLYALWLE